MPQSEIKKILTTKNVSRTQTAPRDSLCLREVGRKSAFIVNLLWKTQKKKTLGNFVWISS